MLLVAGGAALVLRSAESDRAADARRDRDRALEACGPVLDVRQQPVVETFLGSNGATYRHYVWRRLDGGEIVVETRLDSLFETFSGTVDCDAAAERAASKERRREEDRAPSPGP